MPKSTVPDAQHLVYTDHSIPRRPRATTPAPKRGALVLFGGGKPSDRDLGFAYAITGDRERPPHSSQKPPPKTGGATYLAEIDPRPDAGNLQGAVPAGLALAPQDVSALVGLGAIAFEHGDSPAPSPCEVTRVPESRPRPGADQPRDGAVATGRPRRGASTFQRRH